MEGRSWKTLSGSRARDAVLFLALAAAIGAASPRLRAYFRVTVTRITVERIDASGEAQPLATPAPLAKSLYAYGPHALMMRKTHESIVSFMADAPPPYRGAGGGQVVRWTVYYAYNSLELNQKVVVEFGDDGSPL